MMRTMSVAGLAIGFMACAVSAQSTDQNQPVPAPVPQPQIIRLAPRSPLSGVPARLPDAKVIQGVPAKLLSVPSYSGGRTLTPYRFVTPPGQTQTSTQPPPPAIGDNTRSDLVRRLYGVRDDGRGGRFISNDRPVPFFPYTSNGDSLRYSFPVFSTSGGVVRGYYSGNDWRLGFHIGAGFPTVNYRRDSSLFKYPVGLYRSYYAPWEDYGRYLEDPYRYVNQSPYMIVTSGDALIADPRLFPQAGPEQVRELTALEKAELYLRAGNGAEAVKHFKAHLKDAPDDAGVERLLALALIDDRKVDQAVAVLMHAYSKQPQLARDPVDPGALSGGEMDHRDRFRAVMDYANRVKTASSSFAGAVLAQSEGRLDIAKKLLDRAIATGLDKKVAEEMLIALANR